jgi:hypothetical protein
VNGSDIMTDKEMKKLKRTELLEMLLEQTRRVEALEAELAQKNAELESKRIIIQNAGSIAEAALSLNGVFESAQKAVDQYIYNIEKMYGSLYGNNE